MGRLPSYPASPAAGVSRGRAVLLALLLLLGCRATDESSPAAEVRKIVDAVVEAYGGAAALERAEAYRTEGLLTSAREDEQATIVRWVRRPDRLRVEVRYPGRGEVRVARDGKAWTGPGDRELEPAGGAFLASMRLQAARLRLPLILRERAGSIEILKPDPEDRHVLRLDLDRGLSLLCHVDPKKHRIESVETVHDGADPARFRVDLGEFRWIDGVLFPFREDLAVNGEPASTYLCREVKVNPRIPAPLFREERDP